MVYLIKDLNDICKKSFLFEIWAKQYDERNILMNFLVLVLVLYVKMFTNFDRRIAINVWN